jgi:hypothetical protein
MKVLFGREWFTRELPWQALGPLLPGWDIAACPLDQVVAHLDGVFRRTGELFAASLHGWGAGGPPLWPVNRPRFVRGRG